MGNIFACILLQCLLGYSSGARILGIFPHVAKSHFMMSEVLMKGLAARGHEVTVISHFPQKTQVANFTDISLIGSMPSFVSTVPLDDIATGWVYTTVKIVSELGVTGCEKTLSHPPVQKLMNSKEKFDLVITELFNTDCYVGFAYKFKVPFISIVTTPLLPWGYERFANPDNPAYIGNIFLGHSDRMSFLERLVNTVYMKILQWEYHYWFDMPSQMIARKYFGETLPPLADIVRNTSLVLVNRHFTLNQPVPNVPAVIEVGGLHVEVPKKLPEDIDKYLNESEHGAIFFSLGSTVRADTFSQQKIDAFLQAFSVLPQRVLWKWEGEALPEHPKNIKIAKWLPQADVLGHPNVKVFITHGGLMGTMEAVFNGVPMVAIPLFGDQFHNVRNYEEEGVAIKLDYSTITKEKVLRALKEVLNNPSYKQNAVTLSRAFRDRPMSPLNTAIFWTEYVIRHGGASHMRSAALYLTWYQYLLLDVISVLFLFAAGSLITAYVIIKRLLQLLKLKSSDKAESKKLN
ncbi:UDP-glucuronosyltransferase 2B15-like isoform X1 [Zootermopsis nevadensis]|uniref:UDP-glucuronosyltransferase 2B15-like isoform X1 n=1 Tax=Zootermopsis nevadensis TaxID=136037 RepID=UPI000B8E5DED|nr:UDP-glucuronosyltransferase 2B15-like isoform X1 [Zootermopsis nevadensis]XP_021940883.1 UDP-glucuronosyltransferase 2B15-like isoform X1 [Zootermopsis nevadensis]